MEWALLTDISPPGRPRKREASHGQSDCHRQARDALASIDPPWHVLIPAAEVGRGEGGGVLEVARAEFNA